MLHMLKGLRFNLCMFLLDDSVSESFQVPRFVVSVDLLVEFLSPLGPSTPLPTLPLSVSFCICFNHLLGGASQRRDMLGSCLQAEYH